MFIKKEHALVAVLLVSLAGCGGKRKGSSIRKGDKVVLNDEFKSVNIPLSEDASLKSFFDEDLGDFVALGEDEKGQAVAQEAKASDYSWVDAVDQNGFKTVYFNFNHHDVRDDQRTVVSLDVERAKEVLKEAQAAGENTQIIIEGHACHSAGSAVYNLALSEQRAKEISDWFVAQGVSRDRVKIVGRGQEVPAVIAGKQVTGSREEQWANRRVEFRALA